MKKLLKLLIVALLCSACWSQAPQQPQPKTGQVGRFQIALYQGEMPRMNTFLLDTATGTTWMIVSAPDGANFWEPMYKVDNDTEEAIFIHKHQKTKDDPAK